MPNTFLNRLLEINSTNQYKILILGLGRENLQFLEWALNVMKINPANIALADAKEGFDKSTLPVEIQNSGCYLGKNYLDSLQSPDIKMVIKAPGIWSLHPKLIEFRSREGIDSIHSSMVFFFEKFRDRIVAVNGTKGKTTTCNLLKHLLKNKLKDADGNNLKVEYCGNTSNISPYQFWTESGQELKDYFFVVETSSFQLQDLGFAKISPKFAVITNYYIDHLDQHSDKFEYWVSKDNIFLYQEKEDYLIVSRIVQDNLEYRSNLAINDTANYSKYFKGMPGSNYFVIEDEHIDLISREFTSPLVGRHNWSNTALAMTASELITQSFESISTSINELELEHISKKLLDQKDFYQSRLTHFVPVFGRMQLVEIVNQATNTVLFYNDTAATEPEAVMAAIKAIDGQKWLLLSGKVKEGQYTELVGEIVKQIDDGSIIGLGFFGPIGERLKGLLIPEKLDKVTVKSGSIKEFWQNTTLQDLTGRASSGQTISVILSPCGSSFDEFNNYIERGDMFINWAKNIRTDNSKDL